MKKENIKFVLKDNRGKKWEVIKGNIEIDDYAFFHDTSDVIYIDEDDDLYFRNETCSRVIEYIN